ncbi:DHA2 family efflux MFS transporter permease subunit [Peterkaempfera griseoplana]|uniref:DHA2 family efflux MFS transporter permease subunit n=1 Tax=Peterkaempfera griseoplana TaxID=66896 RepID=UPI0006E21CE9|nr:DHA2 family efflux MFS transporter permease subunit [Peterkaempfera griseoplana]
MEALHTLPASPTVQKVSPTPEHPPYPRRWVALGVLAVAQFMVVLDSSIVNIALPDIGTGLHMAASSLSWVVTAYVLTFGGLLMLGGRIADLRGRRATFLAGLIGFGTASAVAAFAPTAGILIAARAVQGAAAALMSPAALSLVTTLFPSRERSKALGVWGAVAGCGGAAGVLLGGVLTGAFGWPSIFLVNLPVAAAVTAGTLRYVPAGTGTRGRIDLPGALTLTTGLASIVYGLSQINAKGITSPLVLSALGLGALLLAAFVATERAVTQPLVPLRIFRLRTVTSANVIMAAVGAATVGLFFFLSLYLQQILHYTPLKAGLSQLPLALMIITAATLAPQLAARTSTKTLMVTGPLLLATGLGWFSTAAVHGSFAGDILGPSLLVGAGLGLSFVSVNITAAEKVAPADAGLAGGLINTTQQIGGALGLALLSAVATRHTGTSPTLASINSGYQAAFLAGTAIAAAAALLAALIAPRRGRSTQETATRRTL